MTSELSLEQLNERLRRVERMLADLRELGPIPRLGPITSIILDAGNAMTIAPKRIIGPDRSQDVAQIRFAIIWAAREAIKPKPAWARLGRELGQRDHSSMMNGFNRAVALRETDFTFRELSELLLRRAQERNAE